MIRKGIEHNLKINNSNIEKGDFVRLLNSNSFVCSRQRSDYGSERTLNRAEASGAKSDEISNYRFSGGRWAKASNRDIFGGVMVSAFFAGFWKLFSATKVAENCCFLPRKNVPIGRYFLLTMIKVLTRQRFRTIRIAGSTGTCAEMLLAIPLR